MVIIRVRHDGNQYRKHLPLLTINIVNIDKEKIKPNKLQIYHNNKKSKHHIIIPSHIQHPLLECDKRRGRRVPCCSTETSFAPNFGGEFAKSYTSSSIHEITRNQRGENTRTRKEDSASSVQSKIVGVANPCNARRAKNSSEDTSIKNTCKKYLRQECSHQLSARCGVLKRFPDELLWFTLL